MSDELGTRILALLDVISVEVAANGAALIGLGAQVTEGFDRVDVRFGRLETRVEDLETEVRGFRMEFERRVGLLERRLA